MIEVRIRHEDEATAVHLCIWPAPDLDDLIPTIRNWGVADNFDKVLTGQFVIDEQTAYFEVLISDDQ